MNSKWVHVIFMVLLVAVSILIFYKTLAYDFVADDRRLIYDKRDFIKDWSSLKTVFTSPFPAETFEPLPFYRPVITFVNFLNFHLLGKTTRGYHVVNLGFHILNALLLYLLVFLIFKRELLSFFVALFFAAHPIHTNSVVWISGRTDLIACFFVLLTVLFFYKARDRVSSSRSIFLGLSFLTYLLAIFSKEIVLALPLFLFVWDYLSEKEPIKRKIIPYIPFIVLTILYLILRIAAIGNLGTGGSYASANLFERFLTTFAIYFYYFKMFVFPVFLNFSPRVVTITSIISLKFWGTLLFFAVVLALGLSLRRGAKEVSFGIFWILVTLVPVLNLVPLYASVKEWWAYIPSIGFCLILGRLAELGVGWQRKLLEIKLPQPEPEGEKMAQEEVKSTEEPPWEEEEISEIKPRRLPERIVIRAGYLVSLFFVLLLIFYAFRIQSRAVVFVKDYHLWTNTSRIAPWDGIAHNAIGDLIKMKGVTRWAKMAFQRAVKADPNFAEARNNFGITLSMSDQDDSALVQVKEAIRIDPEYVDAYNSLGIVYNKLGEYDSSIMAFEHMLKLDPSHFLACKNLGLMYSDLDDLPRAMEYLQKALQLAPNEQEAETIQNEMKMIRVRGYQEMDEEGD
jgi:tetratricopeptide (TPR) repeat protein